MGSKNKFKIKEDVMSKNQKFFLSLAILAFVFFAFSCLAFMFLPRIMSGVTIFENENGRLYVEEFGNEIPESESYEDPWVSIDFGAYGAYKAVYDTNENQYTLGWWNENMSRIGSKNLADLKRDGGSLTFSMPADGWINNSAGELFVDGEKWDLGNYGEDQLESTMIRAGQTVTVSYGPNNDSAGFQLWFKK